LIDFITASLAANLPAKWIDGLDLDLQYSCSFMEKILSKNLV